MITRVALVALGFLLGISGTPGWASEDFKIAVFATDDSDQMTVTSSQAGSTTECCATKRSAILTFDDGPAPVDALQSIMQTLHTHGIMGIFYVRGDEVSKYPDGASLIPSSGHIIQNHSWDHPDLSKLPPDEVQEQITKTQDIIIKVTGKTPIYLRLPERLYL